jgi:hypothetical protein
MKCDIQEALNEIIKEIGSIPSGIEAEVKGMLHDILAEKDAVAVDKEVKKVIKKKQEARGFAKTISDKKNSESEDKVDAKYITAKKDRYESETQKAIREEEEAYEYSQQLAREWEEKQQTEVQISKKELSWAVSVATDELSNTEAIQTLQQNPAQAIAYINDGIKELTEEMNAFKEEGEIGEANEVNRDISKMQKLVSKLEESGILLNQEDAIISELEEFDTEYTDIQNNPEKMLELMKILAEQDRVGVSESHRKHLQSVLREFVDSTGEYIRETTIKIKEKYEGGNEGAFSIGKGEIYLGIGINDPDSSNNMGMEEVFVHEVLHAAVEHAKNDNKEDVVHALTMLDRLYEQAEKAVKPTEGLTQETLDYIFNRNTEKKNHGVSEFIAYAITNEAFMKELNKLDVKEKEAEVKSMTEWVHRLIKKVFDAIFGLERGAKGLKIDEAVMKFSMELARANNVAVNDARRNIIQKVTDKINGVEDKVAANMQKIAGKFDGYSYHELFGTYGRIGGLAASAVKFAGDKEAKDKLLTWMDQTGHSILDKRNSLQTIIRHLRDTDDYDMVIQKMGMKAGTVERAKKERESTVHVLARKEFKELSREEDNALGHAVVETDMSTLKEYSTEEIIGLMESNTNIDAEVKALLESLELDEKTYNLYHHKLKQLGEYMATGHNKTTGIGLMVNTKLISNNNAEQMETLDKVATLMALRYTSEASRTLSATVMKREEKGVRNLMEIQDAVKISSKKLLFSKEDDYAGSNYIQGYTRDSLNPDMDTKVAPASMQEEMEKEGYIRVEILTKSKYDTSGVTMALYISNEAARQPYHRGVVGIVDNKRRGTTFTELHVEENGVSGYLSADKDIETYKKAVIDAERQMAEGTYNPVEGNHPIPVRDLDGNVVDARYVMSKANKVKYLQRDSRATVSLSKTDAAAVEKSMYEAMNVDAMDLLLHDMKTMMTDENKADYIEIDPDSMDEEVKEMYKLLPKYLVRQMQDGLEEIYPGNYMEGKNGKKLWVRKDVYRQVFGYRGFTMTDWAKQSESYRAVRYAIRMAEKIWKAIVSIAKVTIIIKTPAVLVSNVVSNFLYAVMNGIPLDKVYKDHMDAIEMLAQYQKDQREYDKITVQETVKKTKEGQVKLKNLQARMERSNIHEMMKAGMFPSIIEDVEQQELDDPNRLVRRIDEIMEKVPSYIRVGADYLYLTKRTPIFKYMTKATQYSDFLSRYTLMNHYIKLGMKAGLSKEQAAEIARSEAIEAFINYDVMDSKLVQYANEMGLIMFTKYLIRIQKVIRKGVMRHPIQFISALLGQAVLFDLEDITNSTMFLNKDPMGNLHGMGDTLGTVLMPAGYQILKDYTKII